MRRKFLAVTFVVHPWGFDRDRTGAGDDLTLAGVTVADHQTPAGLIEIIGVGVEIGLAFSQQGSGQHLLSSQPAQFVEIDRGGRPAIGGLFDRFRLGMD